MTVDQELAGFCEQEYARLVGSLALYVGDRHTAEELAHDALVRLCQHWSRVGEMSNPHGWLYRVAFNLARSMFRRRSAERRAMARHGGSIATHESDDATTIAVRQAVAELSPRMREAIIRRFLLGDSVRQTAQAMGCAAGTVKSLTHKGLGALREAGLHHDSIDVSIQEVRP